MKLEKKGILAATWHVRFTLPPKSEGNDSSWAKNGTATCVCTTAEEALGLVREQYPSCTIFAVNHRGREETLFSKGFVTLVATPSEGDPHA